MAIVPEEYPDTVLNDKQIDQCWLAELVPKLKPWEGDGLKTGYVRQVVKTTEVVVWVPKALTGTAEPKEILPRLKTQNRGLRTKLWQTIAREQEPKGVTLVLDIYEASLDALGLTHL
ncbi:hypothetical protein HHI36_001059 [Cryptolaemus montrouzieri]|uniref:DUF4780 domain-containing protein n=1 Tax=Cryptolaemus montrouzieri TaxID=559131 RepID=A0ABD2P7D9_9CUCU